MRNRQSFVATALAVIFFCSLICVGFAIAEPAAPLPDVEADPLGALVLMVQHWQAGAVPLAIAIGLSVIVAFVRRLQAVMPWMGTDRGGAITALLVALCTSVAAALVEGTGITLAVLTSGAVALFLAVGGRQWLRRLLYPADGSGPVWLDLAWLRWSLGQRRALTTISAAVPTGRELIDATVYGQWAVHQWIGNDKYWTVTHIPSGICIPRGLNQTAASALALLLAHDGRTRAATANDVRLIKSVYDEVSDGFDSAVVMVSPKE